MFLLRAVYIKYVHSILQELLKSNKLIEFFSKLKNIRSLTFTLQEYDFILLERTLCRMRLDHLTILLLSAKSISLKTIIRVLHNCSTIERWTIRYSNIEDSEVKINTALKFNLFELTFLVWTLKFSIKELSQKMKTNDSLRENATVEFLGNTSNSAGYFDNHVIEKYVLKDL